MPSVIATIPKYQFSNSIGYPLVNGTLTVYLAGTVTPTNTWQDSALTILNTNPVVLDSRGECILWLDSNINYKFVLKDSGGIVQWTVDNIVGSSSYAYTLEVLLAAAAGSSKVGFLQAGTGAVPTTMQSKAREVVSVKDFGAVGDGVTDDTIALKAAIATGSALYWPKGTYKISNSLVVNASNVTWRGESREGVIINKIGTVTSGETAVLCPAGLVAQTLEVYDVDAVVILKPNSGGYCNNISFEKITLRRDTKAGYGLYAPRIALSSFNDIDVYTANKGIYIAGCYMLNFTSCTVRDTRNNWVLGDINATNGGGTSTTLVSCWGAGTTIGGVCYEVDLVYSTFTGCGSDYMGYADNGSTTGPTLAIYRFQNSSVTLAGCGVEEARGPIVLAYNSFINISGMHSYHYYANWTGQPYQYAFVALTGSVISVHNPDIIMEGATINIKWGLADGANSSLNFYDPKTYPDINAYTQPATAPALSNTGSLRISGKTYFYQQTAGGNGNAESMTTDGSFGSNYSQGTWNTGHLLLGSYHLWIDPVNGYLRIKNGVPTFSLDGSTVGGQP